MSIIRSIQVLGLLALLVLALGYPVGVAALAAEPISEPVRIGETVFRPFLAEDCRLPEEIHLIGASKVRTFLAAARRVLALVVDWAECKQLLPFSITLGWRPMRGVYHVSRSLNPVGNTWHRARPGRAEEAKAVYREDVRPYPQNESALLM